MVSSPRHGSPRVNSPSRSQQSPRHLSAVGMSPTVYRSSGIVSSSSAKSPAAPKSSSSSSAAGGAGTGAYRSSSPVRPSSAVVKRSPSPSKRQFSNNNGVLLPPKTLPSELANLPYMSERDLVRFLDERPHLKLSHDERDYMFLRRRRASLELGTALVSPISSLALQASSSSSSSSSAAALSTSLGSSGSFPSTTRTKESGPIVSSYTFAASSVSPASSVVSGAVGETPVFKVTILGEEEDTAKDEIFHLFTLPPDAQHLPPCDICRVPFYVTDSQVYADVFPSAVPSASPVNPVTVSHQRVDLELWLPPANRKFDTLRPHYYPATDVFVLVFSIRSRRSFDAIRARWADEIGLFVQNQKRIVPVILVGNHAEARQSRSAGAHSSSSSLSSASSSSSSSPPSSSRSGSSQSPHQLVDSKEALALAQQLGFVKYLEVVSENDAHMTELFRQAVHETLRARRESGTRHGLRENDYRIEFLREDAMLRRHLTCADPESVFDAFDKTFSVGSSSDNQSDGVQYFFSTDSDPSRFSTPYLGPLKLKRPYPQDIRVLACARCRFPSRIVHFRVPEETSTPRGYFDPLSSPVDVRGWGFILVPEDGTRFFYTVDGSKPGRQSPSTLGGYIRLPPFGIGNAFPQQQRSPASLPVIRVVAVRDGCLCSRVAEFRPPGMLAAPRVSFDPVTRVLNMESTSSADAQYHYTVDGSDPSFASPLFSGPVQITGPVTMIRAVALPKLCIPSGVVAIHVPPMSMDHPSPQRLGSHFHDSQSVISSTVVINSSPSVARSVVSENMSITSLQEPAIPVRQTKTIRSPLSAREAAIQVRHKPLTRFYSERNILVQELKGSTGASSAVIPAREQSLSVIAPVPGNNAFLAESANIGPPSPSSDHSTAIAVEPVSSGSSVRPIDSRIVSCKYDSTHGTVLFRFLKDVVVSSILLSCTNPLDAPHKVDIVGYLADGVQISLGQQDVASILGTDGSGTVRIPGSDVQRGLRGLKCSFSSYEGQSGFSLKDVQVVGYLL
ncbi:mitochondrial P-loop-containing NTPase superfamily member [Andalucia godoyi]|uniref:Mitochondrial P-loop-containing NTPase superfamily member n=1 Tax=Andalucia godoyi TaxID=505711 RepID=A0A8K0AI25_ANDGO|nr:mitochondrial P-loop-containing NTPase superfamily member [Andalucia godoyi]|eukprot:ANDGO_05988.mRNA.1 mitochondrial P-loop-containing NTPase superfamily member